MDCPTCTARANVRRHLIGNQGTHGGRIVSITHVVEFLRRSPSSDARLVHKWLIATLGGGVGIGRDEDEDRALAIALQDAGVLPR